MTSDYVARTGSPEPYLRSIAAAGFTHVHWCHQWCTDFLYSRYEIEKIAAWLDECGLRLVDLHGSAGQEKRWVSPLEYERLAGCELVENRIAMVADLGGDVVIMHTGGAPEESGERAVFWGQLRRSLDALEPIARRRGVRIAIENSGHDDFRVLRTLFAEYGADYVGLCYDSGHGNIGGKGLDHLDEVRDRLISVHLHDNDGNSDQHLVPFDGTVEWQRLAAIIARSSYEKCVSMETSMRHYENQEEAGVLRRAVECGRELTEMIEQERSRRSGGEIGSN